MKYRPDLAMSRINLKHLVNEDLEYLVKGRVFVFWDEDDLVVRIVRFGFTYEYRVAGAFKNVILTESVKYNDIVQAVYSDYQTKVHKAFVR